MSCKYLNKNEDSDYICEFKPYHTCIQWEEWTRFSSAEHDLFCQTRGDSFYPVYTLKDLNTNTKGGNKHDNTSSSKNV